MTGTYLLAARAIAEIPEYDSTNSSDVAWVTDKVPVCNRQVENDTIDIWTTFPTDSTSSAWAAFGDAALAFFLYIWYKKIGNDDESKASKLVYDSQIESLQRLAKSDVSTNRKPAMVAASDPRNAKTPLPSQAGIFAFDSFA